MDYPFPFTLAFDIPGCELTETRWSTRDGAEAAQRRFIEAKRQRDFGFALTDETGTAYWIEARRVVATLLYDYAAVMALRERQRLAVDEIERRTRLEVERDTVSQVGFKP